MATNRSTHTPPQVVSERLSASEQAGGALLLLACASIAGLIGWLTTRRRFWLTPILVGATLAAALLRLFHNPPRTAPPAEHAVLAPNDGRVTGVTMVQEQRFLHGPAMRIDLHVRPWNVQVTRSPHSGTVRLRRYEPGEPKTRPDDAAWLGITSPTGARVAMLEVATPLWRRIPSHWARRILCWPELEDSVRAGEVIGHLTLGGTVEVFVPATGSVRVRAGQHVSAGETILAILQAS